MTVSRRHFLALGGSALLLPRVVLAAEAIAPYLGTWKFVGGKRQIDKVMAAADAATEDLNVVFRGLARKMLKDRTDIPKRLQIYRASSRLCVDFGYGCIKAPLDGKLRPWTNRHGDKVKVRHKIAWGGRLLQQIKEKRGQRTNVFVLSEDGQRLTEYATITSERMPADMEFRLSFRRA